MSLEAELEQARGLEVAALADAIEQIGFECTQCGACCTGEEDSEHTATVFPGEVRTIDAAWAEVARPMPYGLADAEDSSETFEWALQTDACGDCMFYESRDKNNEGENEGGRCGIYGDRPLICQTYPFSAVLDAASTNSDTTDDTAGQATAGVVETVGPVNAHECEGLGRDISRSEAVDLARTLKTRTIRELEEAIGVRDNYQPTEANTVVVHDSEGQKRPDGTPL